MIWNNIPEEDFYLVYFSISLGTPDICIPSGCTFYI